MLAHSPSIIDLHVNDKAIAGNRTLNDAVEFWTSHKRCTSSQSSPYATDLGTLVWPESEYLALYFHFKIQCRTNK